jgi:hypothetical protein
LKEFQHVSKAFFLYDRKDFMFYYNIDLLTSVCKHNIVRDSVVVYKAEHNVVVYKAECSVAVYKAEHILVVYLAECSVVVYKVEQYGSVDLRL